MLNFLQLIAAVNVSFIAASCTWDGDHGGYLHRIELALNVVKSN
jgi:hypothetical protein